MERPDIEQMGKTEEFYHCSSHELIGYYSDKQDKYIDHLESQLKEEREKIDKIFKICHGFGDGDNTRRVAEIYNLIDDNL